MSEVKKATPVLPSGTKFFWREVHAHSVHMARPRYDDTLHDVLKPEYWRHHCGLLRADDFIEVLPEGSEWYARLLVVQADQFGAKVKVLQHTVLIDQVVRKESASGFSVDRTGRWWRVIRKQDQQVVKSGLESEVEAQTWIAANYEA